MRCTGPHESYCSGQVSGTCKSGPSPSIGDTFVPLRTSLVRYALHCLQVVLAGARIANPGPFCTVQLYAGIYTGITTPLEGSHPRSAPRPRTRSRSMSVVCMQFALDCLVSMNTARSFKWSTGGAPETVRGLALCLCFFFLVTSIYLHQPFQTSPLV